MEREYVNIQRIERRTPSLEEHTARSRSHPVFQKFTKLYVTDGIIERAEEDKFHKECKEALETGHKFSFVVLRSYIGELASDKSFSTVTLQKAKIAFASLLPYGLNLLKYPEQKEYKSIKKYTAYFCCNIKENLSTSPGIADTILQTMGYQLDASKDEMTLTRVSRSIYEVCFELFLCQFELDRVVAALEFASGTCKLQDAEAIELWDQFVQSNGSIWRQKDFEVFLQNREEERGLKQSLASAGKGRKLPVSTTTTKAATGGIPVTVMDVKEMKITRNTRQISNEGDDSWMYSNTSYENSTAQSISQPRPKFESAEVDRAMVPGLRSKQERGLEGFGKIDRTSGDVQDPWKSTAASGGPVIHRPPSDEAFLNMSRQSEVVDKEANKYIAYHLTGRRLAHYDSRVTDVRLPPTAQPSPAALLKSEIGNDELEKYGPYLSDYERSYDARKGNRTNWDRQLESQVLSADEMSNRLKRGDTNDKKMSTVYTHATDRSGKDELGWDYQKIHERYRVSSQDVSRFHSQDLLQQDNQLQDGRLGEQRTDRVTTVDKIQPEWRAKTGFNESRYDDKKPLPSIYLKSDDRTTGNQLQDRWQGEQRTDRLATIDGSQPEGKVETRFRERTYDNKEFLPAIYNT